MIRVCMNGCFGIMSSETQEEIAKTKDICVVAGVAPRIKDVEKPFPVYTSLADVKEDYDVLMDFSVAAACPDICAEAVKRNKILITGTSGRTEEHEQMLREAAKKIPVFVCYNMNIGLLCFLELVRESMRYYMDWDIELIDQHHSKKLDAPAGITHHLMNIVKEARAVNDIDTESVAALAYPKVNDALHLLHNCGIVPVEICLADGKGVQIILSSQRVILPCAPSKR